jgi:myosin heavy chain 6/7
LEYALYFLYLQSRTEVEKSRRKIEDDLRVTFEALGDLERSKNEVSQAIQRKEKEMAAIAAKMEDEQTLGGKMGKQVKELNVS